MGVRTLRECDRRHEELDANKPFFKVTITVVEMVPNPEDPREATPSETPLLHKEMEVCPACKVAMVANIGRYITLQDEAAKPKKGKAKAAAKAEPKQQKAKAPAKSKAKETLEAPAPQESQVPPAESPADPPAPTSEEDPAASQAENPEETAQDLAGTSMPGDDDFNTAPPPTSSEEF